MDYLEIQKPIIKVMMINRRCLLMLAAVKGIIQGNTVLLDEDVRAYDGTEVIVTLLNYPQKKETKAPVDWDSFVIPTERGQNVAKEAGYVQNY